MGLGSKMSLYLILLLYIPLFLLAFKNSNERLLKIVFFIILLLFIYFHINSGPDHVTYEWAYRAELFSVPFEPIYTLLMGFGKLFNLDYISFLFFFRTFSLLVFMYAALKLNKEQFILLMGLYIPIMILTFELNLLRQALAFHFCLVALVFYMDNKNKLSYLFAVMAVLSHVSSIAFFLIYLVKMSKRNIYIGIILLFVFLFGQFYLQDKINSYDALNAFNLRFDVNSLQVLVLLILPFLFFGFKNIKASKAYYIVITVLSLYPIMIRMYPIAVLLLLPIVTSIKLKPKGISLIIFISISLILAYVKTNLLIQADIKAINSGEYISGYIK